METKFKIQLEFSGLVLFDPNCLEGFCTVNNIKRCNILDDFVENPLIGDKAISEGIVLPIYNIQSEDYYIIITDNQDDSVYDLFRYKSFPLRVTNNKVIISDIYALINWEPDFYKSIPIDRNVTASNYAVYMKNGYYSIDIIGFYINEKDFGYKIIFKNVIDLPIINGDINSYNFEVIKLERNNGKMNVLPYSKG